MIFKFTLEQKDLLLNNFIEKHPQYSELFINGKTEGEDFLVDILDKNAFEIGELCMNEFMQTLDKSSEPTGNGAIYNDINAVLALN